MWSGQSLFAHLQSSSSVADDFNRTHHNSRFVSGLAEMVHNRKQNNRGNQMEHTVIVIGVGGWVVYVNVVWVQLFLSILNIYDANSV